MQKYLTLCQISYISSHFIMIFAQSAGTVEYTDWTSAEG